MTGENGEFVENVSEKAKETIYHERSLAIDEVCSGKTSECRIAVKSTGFREIEAHDCYHIGFPKRYCVGKHAL